MQSGLGKGPAAGEPGTSREARKLAERGRMSASGAGLRKLKRGSGTSRSVMTAHGRMSFSRKSLCRVCGKVILRAVKPGMWFHARFLKGEAHYEHLARPRAKETMAL